MRITTIINVGIFLVCIVFIFGINGRCFAEDSKETKTVEQDSEEIFSYSYGRYHIFLGSMRTEYKDSRHEVFFPHPQWGAMLGCDYYYFRKYVGLGVQFKLGFWKDRGHPSKTGPSDGYTKDDSVSLTRPIFPMSLSLILNFTPIVKKIFFIPKKLISFKAWFGGEYLFGQEQRSSGEDKAYVDNIRRTSTVFGVSPGLRISIWDRKSVNTLDVINVKDIYLYPYMEWTKETGSKKVSFDRKIFGIQLSFETI